MRMTLVCTQKAGGCVENLTASSRVPCEFSSPGDEHMENPPTISTPGMCVSTLQGTKSPQLRATVSTPGMCVSTLQGTKSPQLRATVTKLTAGIVS